MPLAEAYDYAAGVMVDNMMHAEAKEGIGAFIEKRPPVWAEELSAPPCSRDCPSSHWASPTSRARGHFTRRSDLRHRAPATRQCHLLPRRRRRARPVRPQVSGGGCRHRRQRSRLLRRLARPQCPQRSRGGRRVAEAAAAGGRLIKSGHKMFWGGIHRLFRRPRRPPVGGGPQSRLPARCRRPHRSCRRPR